MNSSELLCELRRLGGTVNQNEPLSNHTGFKTGGLAELFYRPDSAASFSASVELLEGHGAKYYVLGNGSDVLASDSGYKGVVVCTQDIKEIRLLPDNRIYCEAGSQLRDLCIASMENGLSGAEFAFGIPGTVGGAVYMNAGAYGGEIKDIIESAVVFDGVKVMTITHDKLQLSYRNSIFQSNPNLKIIGAYFMLAKGNSDSVRALMEENLNKRKSKQPLNLPSCGSAFKRPAGGYASALIEKSGLKGFAVGGAAVSEKHCGFVVNLGGATSSEILELLEIVKSKVFADSGILLEPEIRVME